MKTVECLKQKLNAAFRGSFSAQIDQRGYVRTPTDNLLPGVAMEQFEQNLLEGAGDELRTKFCAVHSSSALAVNCFAPYVKNLDQISLFDESGASEIRFEKKLPVFPRARAPHLDVWIERNNRVIAIESKFLEYFKPKRPKKTDFKAAYERLAPPGLAEKCWWEVYNDAKQRHASHLNRVQLVKHYFGMRKYQEKNPVQMTLLYVFWEPTNGNVLDECIRHRSEIEAFKKSVEPASKIEFRWMTYSDLWKQWSKIPSLSKHAADLKARYEISL